MGTWPWPRSYHAALLRVLRESRPAAVFFDMILSEPSAAADDLALAREIELAGNVILAFYYVIGPDGRLSEKPEGVPIPEIGAKAKGVGFVNALPDADGHVREMVVSVERGGKRALSAPLATVSAHLGSDHPLVKKIIRRKKALLNFPGPYEVFKRIPFENVIAAHEDPQGQSLLQSLAGKVILIGHTATGTALDLKPSPYSPLYPGVGLQASALHTFLAGRFIRRMPLPILFLLHFLFALLILRLCVIPHPARSAALTALALAAAFVFFQLSFQFLRIWIPIFGFFVLGSSLFVGMMLKQFVKASVEAQIFSRELTLAARIQKNFLPAEIPKIPGLEMAAATLPAKQVGGDLYDILKLRDGKWGVCVGDVSGKGIPAALLMAKATSELRREADTGSASEVMQRLNTRLANEGIGGLFLTLVFVVIDPARRKIYFANGGHEPILYYQKDQKGVELLKTRQGPPLGIDAESPFDLQEKSWAAGDVFVLQSDGVKEAMNTRREIFGFDRAKSAIAEAASRSAQGILDHLIDRIQTFVGNAPQHDDLTIVCGKFT